jgi:hypothetical protein
LREKDHANVTVTSTCSTIVLGDAEVSKEQLSRTTVPECVLDFQNLPASMLQSRFKEFGGLQKF